MFRRKGLLQSRSDNDTQEILAGTILDWNDVKSEVDKVATTTLQVK
jgi:hypothetical protein